MDKIRKLVRTLGITPQYKGYQMVIEAIRYRMEDMDRPMRITKETYPRLARKFQSKPQNVEQNIRTIVDLCWRNHPEKIREMAGYHVLGRPTNAEFVEILAFYLKQQEESES